MSTLDLAKAKLLKADANGVSLHDHLSATLARIITEDPEDALAMFEQISLAVKQQNVLPRKEYLRTVPQPAPPSLVAKRDVLRAKPELPEDAEFPNVIEDNTFLEHTGYALVPDEAYLLRAAMAKLMADKVLKTIRFFGKILGTGADYYIVEGAYSEEPEVDEETAPPPVPLAEDNGTGCNKFRYWVCNELGAPWVELPAVNPAAIVAARGMKKHFTGTLSARVVSHPPFPGVERDYLRAQIARILHSTYVAPSGMFSFEDDSEEEPKPIQATEEWEAPEPEEMCEPTSWVHYYSTILKVGRCSKPPKPDEEEGEEGGAEEEEDESNHLLNDLSADPPILESEETPVPAWTIRKSGAGKYVVACATSNSWPGAVAFCSTKPSLKFANLYLGYGLENTGRASFAPALHFCISHTAEDRSPRACSPRCTAIRSRRDPVAPACRARLCPRPRSPRFEQARPSPPRRCPRLRPSLRT
jgi:radial spoke head protein 4A